ncbi:ethanolamine ammonia-lyase subunit EutC [Nocardia otitidiscaviarum]|nr:ethanolamine ammonia-lyase subunit EutC [Nocardia otitidiscaviarum]MCP9624320.1 ethanolamine ammonia-lyase subunit EutC [Nocardia otitidiscaviarum]
MRGDSLRTDTARTGTSEEFWAELRRTTQARIGLGRTGDALPTERVLDFRAAHAAARDAVHTPLAVDDLAARVAELGLGRPTHVRSRAADRSEYLRRPDLGRLPAIAAGAVERKRTSAPEAAAYAVEPHSVASNAVASNAVATDPTATDAPGRDAPGTARTPSARPVVGETLSSSAGGRTGPGIEMDPSSHVGQRVSASPGTGADIGFVLADGLSPRALAEHGVPMLRALVAVLGERYTLAPPVIATQARVALGDHIGESLGVATVLVLIGERPGLSVADSLGIYLTHLPRPGRADSERNCISNIHPPEGLGYERAARVAAGLVEGARGLGRSGVDLKDTSVSALVPGADAFVLEAGGAQV